jgi:hypothetical protein
MRRWRRRRWRREEEKEEEVRRVRRYLNDKHEP